MGSPHSLEKARGQVQGGMAMAGRNRRDPLHVAGMAVALALAAFTGAALGLVWQSAGLGEQAPVDPAADLAAGPDSAAD